ncbi:MAG: mobile mystery protein B [Bacteroidia bacterium]|nr:mobile mystery protein B [Bacteroidia bacterium]
MGLKKGDSSDGQTLLSEGDRDGLLIKSIRTREELNRCEHLNIQEALEWTLGKNFDEEELLSEQFTRDIHRRMFGSVWEWAGKFRRSDTNLGVNWKQIPVQLRQLNDDVRLWIKEESFPPDELVIRNKHRLVCIHAFPNGNGRHSRLMADLLIRHVFDGNYYTWGSQATESSEEIRERYLKALREADRGKYTALIRFARS